MSIWFRFYTEALEDPKVQILPSDAFRYWVNCLCLASRNDGYLPVLQSVSFAFHRSEEDTEKVLTFLVERGLLDSKKGRLTPHNWFKRQYKSDSSKDRVAAFRKRKRNVTETLLKRPQKQIQNTETESDTETEEKGIPAAEKRAGKPDIAAELFKAAYQVSRGNPYEWLSGDFTGIMKLRKRLKIETRETPDQWEPAIANYFASPFDQYSLRHFVSKFDTFRNSALDRFKVPINHKPPNGNGYHRPTPAEIDAAAAILRKQGAIK